MNGDKSAKEAAGNAIWAFELVNTPINAIISAIAAVTGLDKMTL